MNFKIALISTAFVLSGCASQTFVMSGATTNPPTKQESMSFFIYGVGQEQVVDAAKICGGVEKVVKIESQETVMNIVFRVVTFGIYTPRDAKVYCK
jgi:Bor protein